MTIAPEWPIMRGKGNRIIKKKKVKKSILGVDIILYWVYGIRNRAVWFGK